MGIHELHLKEEDLWNMTPRKYYALMDCAKEYMEMRQGKEKTSKSVIDGNIDDINW